MPAFLHFYPQYDHASYRRIPHWVWLDLKAYMDAYMKAMSGGR